MSLTTGLTHHWKLDETTGDFADSVGSFAFFRRNSASTVTGKIGNGIQTTIAGAGARTAIQSTMRMPAGESRTIAFWAKLTGDPSLSMWFVSRWEGSDRDFGVVAVPSAGGMQFVCRQNSDTETAIAQANMTFSQDEWYFVVCEFDHTSGTYGTSRILVNNTYSGEYAFTSAKTSPASEYSHINGINSQTAGTGDAVVDSYSFWTRLLTAQEKTQLWNNGNGLDYPLRPPTIYGVNGKEPIAAWIPSLDTAGNGTTTLTDLVGSNNGTLTNMDAATDWVSDTSNGGVRALDFDGSNDYVSINDADELDGYSTFTCSLWVNVKGATSFGTIVAKGDRWRFYRNNSGNIRVRFNGSTYDTTTTYLVSNWRHLVFVIDGTNVKLFEDNVETFSALHSTGTGTDASRVTFGAMDGGSSPGNVLLDDIRIFDQALDASDIAYLYNSGNGRGITASGVVPSRRRRYAGGYGL
jgi:hypothetical protein